MSECSDDCKDSCVEPLVIVKDFEDRPDIQKILQNAVDSQTVLVWDFNEAPECLRERYSYRDEVYLMFFPSTSRIDIDVFLGTRSSGVYTHQTDYGTFVVKYFE